MGEGGGIFWKTDIMCVGFWDYRAGIPEIVTQILCNKISKQYFSLVVSLDWLRAFSIFFIFSITNKPPTTN